MKERKGKNIVIILMGVSIGILLLLCILFVTGTIRFDKEVNNDGKIPISDGQVPISNSIKIDDSKDYVYDADYKYNNRYKEFFRRGGSYIVSSDFSIEATEKQSLENLKVPYINIHSYDAGYANGELKNLYLSYAKEFDSCAENESCSQILTYRTYQYHDILSVVVIDSIQRTSLFILNYHIYNFDLSNGTFISYKDMLSKLGYNEVDFTSRAKDLMKNKMNDTFKGIDFSNCYFENNSCYSKTYEMFENSISDNSILFFVDNDGNLNILPILYVNMVENGDRNHYLITINAR